MDASLALLAVLAFGHLLGDFVLQTQRMVEAKRTRAGLLRHVGVVALSHAAALAPLALAGGAPPWTSLAVAVAALALVHGAIDAWKVRQPATAAGSVGTFLLDQAFHAASILVVWSALVKPWNGAWWTFTSTQVAHASILASAYVLNGTAAGALIGLALRRLGLDGNPGHPNMGRAIGILERMLILTLVLLGQWGAIGFALTAKTVARFPSFKNDQQHFAEYFLLGTLMSALFAVSTGLAVRLFLGWA